MSRITAFASPEELGLFIKITEELRNFVAYLREKEQAGLTALNNRITSAAKYMVWEATGAIQKKLLLPELQRCGPTLLSSPAKVQIHYRACLLVWSDYTPETVENWNDEYEYEMRIVLTLPTWEGGKR